MFPIPLLLKDIWKGSEVAKPEVAGPKPRVSPEAAMALTLWLADAVGLRLDTEEISEVLFRLGQEKRYEPPYSAMRKVPGGVFSEDVAQWTGRLIFSGYTRSRLGDPVELSEDGLRICRMVLEDERKLNKELDFFLLARAIIELLSKYQPH